MLEQSALSLYNRRLTPWPAGYAGHAKVAELVDALDLGSSGATRGSSSLPFRTNIETRVREGDSPP